MVNPVLTVLFDLFHIGSGTAVLTGMYLEHRAARRPAVGGVMVPFTRRAHRQAAPLRTRRVVVGRARRRLAA